MAKAPTPKSLNLRKGDDTQNCKLCVNWGTDGTCSVLQKITQPTQVCDAFKSVEIDQGTGKPVAGSDAQTQMLIDQLFGGAANPPNGM